MSPERFMTVEDHRKFKAIRDLIGEEGVTHLAALIAAAQDVAIIAEEDPVVSDDNKGLEDALAWANDILGNNDDWTTLTNERGEPLK